MKLRTATPTEKVSITVPQRCLFDMSETIVSCPDCGHPLHEHHPFIGTCAICIEIANPGFFIAFGTGHGPTSYPFTIRKPETKRMSHHPRWPKCDWCADLVACEEGTCKCCTDKCNCDACAGPYYEDVFPREKHAEAWKAKEDLASLAD